MSFSRKAITPTFTLGTGSFAGTTANTLTLPGLRVSLEVHIVGGAAKDQSEIRIWGMTKSQMNQLSLYGVPAVQPTWANGVPPPGALTNKISITAGDAQTGMSKVFEGTIWDAFADYDAQPDPFFVVRSMSTLYYGVQTIPPTTAPGSVSAASLIQQLAKTMGLRLENNGVAVNLTNPYHTGSTMDQIEEIAHAGNFNFYPDVANGVLAIWPANQTRLQGGGAMVNVSPQTGLVGYPNYSNKQVRFRTIYDPNLVFGRQFQLTSSVTPACGLWTPMEIDIALESETPNGVWFQDVAAFRLGT